LNTQALSFRQTRAHIRADFQRWVDWLGGGTRSQRLFWTLLPSFQALLWYRLSRYLYLRGWKSSARLLFLFKLYLTRVEIPPTTSIGPGCLIAHAGGVVIYGSLGERVTFFGDCGTGGGVRPLDIGGGPGYPVVGNDVTFSYRAMVLGPVRIGDGARLGPCTLTLVDVPARGRVFPPRSIVVDRDTRFRNRRRTGAGQEVTE
jgi:serine acetyltransferase